MAALDDKLEFHPTASTYKNCAHAAIPLVRNFKYFLHCSCNDTATSFLFLKKCFRRDWNQIPLDNRQTDEDLLHMAAGQCEIKGGANADLALHPHFTAMSLDDVFHYGQPKTCST